MMISRITNFAFEARPIDLQVQLSGGSSAFDIVGLPDEAVGARRLLMEAILKGNITDSFLLLLLLLVIARLFCSFEPTVLKYFTIIGTSTVEHLCICEHQNV